MVLKFILNIVFLVVIIFLLYQIVLNLPPNTIPGIGNLSTINLSYPTTSIPNNYVPQNQTINETLSFINQNRSQFGIGPVSYSNESSGQQHAESMLQNGYFSHWDFYGLKPYMRYTILGGRGSVDENVAFEYDSAGINVLQAISKMEWGMMYNDSVCCNNGHRNNILDPNHNQVSIGVAYNSTTVYLVEDFIDNYISWVYGTPSYSNDGSTALKGTIASQYSISAIDISYDPVPQNLTKATIPKTPYGFGSTVACIGHTSGLTRYYCTNTETVNASVYTIQGQNFDIEFNMKNITKQYGAGVYTIMIYFNNSDTEPMSTYSIFINQSGGSYTPSNV